MWSSSFTGFARGATATTIDAHLEDFFDEKPATPSSDLLRSYEALRKKRADSETSPLSVASNYDAAFHHGQPATGGIRTSPLAELSLLDLPDNNITPIRLQYSPQKASSASPHGTFALPKLQASPSMGSQLEPAEPQLLPAAATAAGREPGSNSSKYSLRGRIRQGSEPARQPEPQQDITSQKQAAGTPTHNPGANAAQQQSTSVRVQHRQNSRHAAPGETKPVAPPKRKSNALHVASTAGKDAAPAAMSAGRAKSAAGAAAVRNARANLARTPTTEPTKQSKAPAAKTAQAHAGVHSKAKAKAPQLEVLGRAAASSAAQLHHMVAEYGTAVTVHRQHAMHAMDPPAALSPAQAYLNKLQQQHGPLKEPAAAVAGQQQQHHAWVETQPLSGFSSPSGSAAASPLGLPLEERQQQRLQRLRDLRMRRSTSTSETGELIRMLEAGEGVALYSQRPSSVPLDTFTSQSSHAYGHPSTNTVTDTFDSRTQSAGAHHRAEISATSMTPASYHLPPPSSPSTSGLHSMASVTSPPHPLYYATHTRDQASLQSPEKQRQISSLQPVHANFQGVHGQRSPQKVKASSPLKVGPREAVFIAGTGDHPTGALMHDQRTAVKVSSAVQTDPQPDLGPAGAKAIWQQAGQVQQQVPASDGAVVGVMAGRQDDSSSPPKPAYLFSSTLTVHTSSVAGEGRNEEEGKKPQISEMIRRFRQAPPMPREQRFGGAAAAASPSAPCEAAAAEPAAPAADDAWQSASADRVAGGTDTGATQTNSTEDEADDDDSSDANAYVDQYTREASSYRQKAYAELREQLAARSPSPQRSPAARAPPPHGVGGRADTRGSPTKGPGEGPGGTYSAAVDGLAVALLQRSRSLLREREQIQQRIHEALHKARPEIMTPVAPAASTAAAASRSTKDPAAAAVASGDSPWVEGTPSWREQLKALLREVHGGKPQQQQPMGSGSMARDQPTPPGEQKPVASPLSPAADMRVHALHGISSLIGGPATPHDSTPPTSSSSSHTSTGATPPPAGSFVGPASSGRSQLRSHTAAPALDSLRQELRSSLPGWMASMNSAVGSPLTADTSSSHMHAASAVSHDMDVPLPASDTGLGPSSAGSSEADSRRLSQEPLLDDVLGQLAARFGLRDASILAPQLFPGPMPTSPAGSPPGGGAAREAANPAGMTESSVPAVSPVGMEAVAGSAAACKSTATGCGDVHADTSLDDKHGIPESRVWNHSDAAPHAPAADKDEVPSTFGRHEAQVQSRASPTGDPAECMGTQTHGTEVQVPVEQPRASGRKRWAVPQPGAAARLSFADNGSSSSSSREAGSPTSSGSPPRNSRLSRVTIRQPELDADQLEHAGFSDGGEGTDLHSAAVHGTSGHGAASAAAAATALFQHAQGLGGDGAASQNGAPVAAATADVSIITGIDMQSGMSTPQSPDWASTPVQSAELASPLHPRRRHAFSPVLGMLLDGAVSGVLFGETSPGSTPAWGSSRDSSVGGAEHDSRLGQKQLHDGDEQQLQQQQQHADCADADASFLSAATPLPASSPQPATSPVPASPAGIDLPTFMARLKALNAAEGLGGDWGMWQDDLPGSPSAQSVDSSRTFQSSGNRLGQLLDQTVSRYLFEEDSVVSGSLRASRDTVRSQLLFAGAASAGGSGMSGSHDWQQQQRQWAPGDSSTTGSLLDLAARQQQQQRQGRDADPWPLPTHVQSAPSSRRGTAEEFAVEPSGGAAAASASSAPSSRRGTREEQSEGLLLRQGRTQQAQFVALGDEQHVPGVEGTAVLPSLVSGASVHSPLEHLTAAQPVAATMATEPWTRPEQDEDSVLMSEPSEPAMSRAGTPVPMQPYADQDPWHPMDPGSERALQQDQDLHQPGGALGQTYASPGHPGGSSSSSGEGAQRGFTSVPTQFGVAAGPEESAAWETPVSEEAGQVPPAVEAAAAAPLLFMMEELLFGAAAGFVAGQHRSGPVAEAAVMSPVVSVPPWSELPPCSIVILDDVDDGVDDAVLPEQAEEAGDTFRNWEEQQQQTGQEQAASSSSSRQGQAVGGGAAGCRYEEEQQQVSAGDGVEGAVLDAGTAVLPGARHTTAVAESNTSSRSNSSHGDSVLQVQLNSLRHGDGEDVQQHLQQPLNLGEQQEFEDRLHDNVTAARMHKLNRMSERSPAKRRHVEEESWPGSPFETDSLLSQQSPPGATQSDSQDTVVTADAPLFNLGRVGRGFEGPHRERHYARRHHAYPHAAAMAHTVATTEAPVNQLKTNGGQDESALSSQNDGVAAAGTLATEPAPAPAHSVPEGLGSGSSDVQPDPLPRLLSAEELMFIVPIPEMQDLHGSPSWGNAAAGELPEPPAAAWKLPGTPAHAGDLPGLSAAAGGLTRPPAAAAAAVVGDNAQPGGAAGLSVGGTQHQGHGHQVHEEQFPVPLQQRHSPPAWQHQHSPQEAASEQQSTWQQRRSYQEATALEQHQQLPEQEQQISSTSHDTIEAPQYVAVHAATQQQYESPPWGPWGHHGDLQAIRQDAAAVHIPHQQVRSHSEAMQQQQGMHNNATQQQQQNHHDEPHQQMHSDAEAMQQQGVHHNAMQQQQQQSHHNATQQQQQQGHHYDAEQYGRHDRSDAAQQQPGQMQALPMPAESAPATRHVAFSAFTPAAAAATPGLPLRGFAAPAAAMPSSTPAHLVQPAAYVLPSWTSASDATSTTTPASSSHYTAGLMADHPAPSAAPPVAAPAAASPPLPLPHMSASVASTPSVYPLPSFAAATCLMQQQEAGAHSMVVPAVAHVLQPTHTNSQQLSATVHGTAHGVPGAVPTYLWVHGTDAMAWSSQGLPATFVAPARQLPAFIAASSQVSASHVAAGGSSTPLNLAGQQLSHSPSHGAGVSLHAMPAARQQTAAQPTQQQQQLSWAAQQQGAALPAQQQQHPMDVKANTQQPQGTFSIQQQQPPALSMQQQQPVSMLHAHLQQQRLQVPGAAATNQQLRVGSPAAMPAAFVSAKAEGSAHVLQHQGEDEDLVVKLLQQKIQSCVQQLRDLGQRLG